jgi:FKBP-type peptidyl-prolyl cis-trans isomerase SlyD
MIIDNNKVVTFHYRLSEIGQEALEQSEEGKPIAYLHGHSNILPALENALAGHQAGDKVTATLSPDEAYGQRQEGRQQRVPIKHLLTKGKLHPGMAVKINTQDGPVDARIIKVGKFNVDVDTNHPLAGLSLTFDITIETVRDASEDEIAHGHAHGEGGHHH